MDPVTNADVEWALKDRKVRDFLQVYKKWYKDQLDDIERESVANWALFKALRGWDEKLSNGRRFSTHLYTVLHWEFDRAAQAEQKHREGREQVSRHAPEKPRPAPDGSQDYLDRYLSRRDADIVRRYRVDGRTAAEIGGELGWSEGRVLRTVHAAEALLRSVID